LDTDLILPHGVPGTPRNGLDGVGVEVVAQPRAVKLRGIGMQIVLAQAKLLVQGAEGIPARLPPQPPYRLKGTRLPQQRQPLQALANTAL